MEREYLPTLAVKGSGDDAHNSEKQHKGYHRHSPYQIAKLEEAFKKCPHPDDGQRREVAEELGLDPTQVKFWFQNKRTQIKTLMDRSVNQVLRLENERIQSENFVLRETLISVLCSSCGGSNLGEEDSVMHNLRMEHAVLQKEHERLSKLLASNNGINPTLPSSSATPSSHDPSGGSLLNQNTGIPQHIPILAPTLDQDIPTLTPTLDQHAPFTPVLDQNIPTLTPNLDQLILTLTPALDQTIPTLTPILDQNIPTPILDQDIPTLTPALDQNISAITSVPDQNIPALAPPVNDQDFPALISALDQDILAHNQDIPDLDLDFDDVHGIFDDYMWPQPVSTDITADREKTSMTEIANTAIDELERLLRMNEPFWFRSMLDGKFILQRESYEHLFHRCSSLKGPRARIESSKDSRIVSMSGKQLVDMFLNPDKWVDLFPTIIKEAQIIQVFENGSLGNRHGALQLMSAKMHILSPLIPAREFYFLRCCKQDEVGVWTIADVSIDCPKHDAALSHAWRFPSGCMIQEITNGSCRVSWVEHVEVDDKVQTYWLFRQMICDQNAFGAERWVLTLDRMCERIERASLEYIPISDVGGVINSVEGRRSVMQLAHRMIKIYGRTVNMSDKMDFQYLTKLNNGGIRVIVRNNTEPGMPSGMMVSAATSFWLPLAPQNVFDFLKDNSRRLEWDVLCNENPMYEIQRISTGTHPASCTKILRPFIPKENDMLILQESYTNSLESLLVYAPIDMATLNVAVRGEDSSSLPLLPSGFIISGDGRSNAAVGQSGQDNKSGGSLITLLFQILTRGSSATGQPDKESVASVTRLVTSAVKKIKVALKCSN